MNINESLQNKILNIPSIIQKNLDNINISKNKKDSKIDTSYKSPNILKPNNTYLKAI